MQMISNAPRKLSLVQVNFQQGPTDCNSFTLPYAIGCLWSYAVSQPEIAENWQLDHVLWRRDDVESTAQKLHQQDLVGFSTYVWNRRWNDGVARRIKELNPNCVIVYGGPEPAISQKDYFHNNPWVDAVIKNEGEITFSQVLKSFPRLDTVSGLLVNRDGVAVDTGEAARIDDLDSLPSPYLTGFFDHLVKEHPEIEWTATLETNRGCPYQCTFCDWGSLTYSKVKKFPLDRVFAELEWTSQNRIAFISLADANFGIFAERDTAIAEKLVELQNQFDFPYGFSTSFAKNQKRDVVNIIEILIKKSKFFNTGLQISLQTLDENVLDIIRRRNLELHKIEDILSIAREKSLPVSTELILGLPGETLSSWKRTIWRLLELDIHDAIDIYYSQLLENAEMNRVQREIYDIQTATIYDYFSPTTNDNHGPYAESLEVTKSTADMSFGDLMEASLFNWFLFTWHVGGLSDMASRFIRQYCGISYEKFYTDLLVLLEQEPWYLQLKQQQHDMVLDWFDNGRVTLDNPLNIKIYGNSLIFFTRQLLHARRDLLEPWYEILKSYLQRFDLPDELLDDLIELQKCQVIDMPNRDQYPMQKHFNHTLWQYIMHKQPLQQQSHHLEFAFPEKHMGDLEYLERLFWSRRRRFGRTWINDNQLTQ